MGVSDERKTRIERRHKEADATFHGKGTPQFGFEDFCLAHSDRGDLLDEIADLRQRLEVTESDADENERKLRSANDRIRNLEAALEAKKKDARSLAVALGNTLKEHGVTLPTPPTHAPQPPSQDGGWCYKCNGAGRTPFERGLHGEVICSRCNGDGKEPAAEPRSGEQSDGMIGPPHDVLRSALRRTATTVSKGQATDTQRDAALSDIEIALQDLEHVIHELVQAQGSTGEAYINGGRSLDYIRRYIEQQPCPHVRTSAEGTSYCALAEQPKRVPDAVRALPGRMRLVARQGLGAETRNYLDDFANELERAIARHDEQEGT